LIDYIKKAWGNVIIQDSGKSASGELGRLKKWYKKDIKERNSIFAIERGKDMAKYYETTK
jgi:hypothetical protein